MTKSPPSEPQHFSGNPLSPASPIPVHIQEPQNIPVLENQIDPIFNLMSTHIENPAPQNHGMGMYTASDTQVSGEGVQWQGTSDTHVVNDEGEVNGNSKSGFDVKQNDANTVQDQEHWQDTKELDKSQNHLTTNTQPSVTLAAYESPSVIAQNDNTPTAPFQSQDHTEARTQQHDLYREVLEPATTRQDVGSIAATNTSEPDSLNEAASKGANVEGASYQALLDNLTASDSVSPTTGITAPATTAVTEGGSQPFSPGSDQGIAHIPITTLPVPVGLPARPPPQEKPAIHPNYAPSEDIRSYHNPTALNTNNAPSSQNAQSSNSFRTAQNYSSQTGAAPNGMAPPPLATFQQPPINFNQPQRSPQTSQPPYKENYGRKGGLPDNSYLEGDSGNPRVPDVEKAFNDFLHDEANYTSQGQWEKFPPGSRLFVGNLFTEKVSKRDLFDIFSKYGNLAQISMKSAYGFIQYVQAEDCRRAMQSEQGLQIRGRKINLEISKPQKNTRNAAAAAAQGNELRQAAYGRRSRSPDYTRGGETRGSGLRNGPDRFDRGPGYNDFRGRDGYRPVRSPSPRGMRIHDSYRGSRDRSPDRYYGGHRTRSRSPLNRGGGYRDRSPGPGDPDDEAALPMARRPPGSAPDVQIILAEEVDRTFVSYIQQSFRDRSLRCEVLQLPRVSMAAVVKRQILEGVQAVVKIFRRSQVTSKIPLQVFNRSQGLNNVQFDEYEDLDAATAAEIVVRARSTHMAPPQMQSQQYPRLTHGAPQYGQPPPSGFPQHNGLHQHMQPQQVPPQQSQPAGAPSNVANVIGSLDGPALQKLLASMSQSQQISQNSQNPQAAPQPNQNPDLAAILSNVTRQQGSLSAPSRQGYPLQGPSVQDYQPQGPPQQAYPQAPQQEYPQQTSQQPGYGLYGGPPQQQFPQQTNQAPYPDFQNNRPPQSGTQPPNQQQQPNVQEIMAQLAKYGQQR